MHDKQHICVGELTTPHGVRGLLRLRVLLDDAAQLLQLPLSKADGTAVKITQRGVMKDSLLVAVDGVNDRNAADAWRRTKLYAPRAALPTTGDAEFYVADLQGLQAVDLTGAVLGTVVEVYDFGAGVSLAIKQQNQPEIIIPFTNSCVPQVDAAAGRITIVLPEIIEARDV